MDLSNFENHFESQILARGYEYYKNDCVTSVEKIKENVFKAKVAGTSQYTVTVELDEMANIIATQCDCPYDLGEYCKHQAAVFLVLRKKYDAKSHVSQKRSIDLEAEVQTPVPKKSKAIDIKQVISERSKDELVGFLLDIASEYEEIKRRIELNFSNGNDADEINKSIALIHTYIDKHSDEWGYVGYGDASEAVKGAEMVLEKARYALEQNKIPHAIGLALCIIQQMVDLLQKADDSDGVIGGMIDESFDFIADSIEEEELSPVQKEEIFGMLMTEAANQRYKGWNDWRLELLGNCTGLVEKQCLRDKLENYLGSLIENETDDSWSSNRFAEKINLIRYDMIERYDGPKKAEKFIAQNLQYSDFRKMAIISAMQKEDYGSVIKLARDGEENDKNLPGLVDRWMEYRYNAYKFSGMLDEQRKIAMRFILKGNFQYYQELKKTYDSIEWPGIYPQIILHLENQKDNPEYVYTHILLEENEKQKLCDYVKGRPSAVELFYKYLMPEFAEDVYRVFCQYIEQTAARANSRKDYQAVCAIIRNLKKAGGKQQALGIKERLLSQYANRPAFRDELSRV